jgi:hypothetical protein
MPVVHLYPAEDVEVTGIAVPSGKTATVSLEGGWWACEKCRSFIDQGDRQGLVQRVVNVFIHTMPGAAYVDRGELAHLADATMTAFWQHRKEKGDDW